MKGVESKKSGYESVASLWTGKAPIRVASKRVGGVFAEMMES